MLFLNRIHWLKFLIRVSFKVLRYQALDGDFLENKRLHVLNVKLKIQHRNKQKSHRNQ